MRSYSHLSVDERDQIGVLRAAGRSIGPLLGRSVRRKPPSPGSCGGTRSPWTGTRRFTPPEPINCAGGVETIRREAAFTSCCRSRLARGMDARADRSVEIRE